VEKAKTEEGEVLKGRAEEGGKQNHGNKKTESSVKKKYQESAEGQVAAQAPQGEQESGCW